MPLHHTDIARRARKGFIAIFNNLDYYPARFSVALE